MTITWPAVYSNNPSIKLLYVTLYEYITIYLSIFLLMDIFFKFIFAIMDNSAVNIFSVSFGAHICISDDYVSSSRKCLVMWYEYAQL